jgi:hypothetical protein
MQYRSVGAFHHLPQFNKGVVLTYGMHVSAANNNIGLLSGLIVIVAN